MDESAVFGLSHNMELLTRKNLTPAERRGQVRRLSTYAEVKHLCCITRPRIRLLISVYRWQCFNHTHEMAHHFAVSVVYLRILLDS